ncbi:MAG TPA: hypothetical protein VNT76_13280 [Candidatus Binatus sp.]|nr:hypothetical protein [Candidatus Binatus sp.]
MLTRRYHRSLSLLVLTIPLLLMFAACGGSRDETISDVAIPVPNAMKKGSDKPAEISILGFGAGQASFHGSMDTDKLIEFYKKEMPARGWQTNMNLRSGGAVLAFSKAGKSVMVGIGKQNDETLLTLTVSGMGR